MKACYVLCGLQRYFIRHIIVEHEIQTTHRHKTSYSVKEVVYHLTMKTVEEKFLDENDFCHLCSIIHNAKVLENTVKHILK